MSLRDIVSSGAFSYDCYLTSQEKRICASLDRRLQEFILEGLLSSSEPANIDLARFIFKLVQENKGLEDEITHFFLRTLPKKESFSAFKKLKALQTEGKLASFFQFTALKMWSGIEAAVENFKAISEPSVLPPSNPLSTSSVSLESVLSYSCSFVRMFPLAMEYLSSLPPCQRLPLVVYEKEIQYVEENESLNENEKLLLTKVIIQITSNGQLAVQGYSSATLQEFITEMEKAKELFGEEFFYAFSITNLEYPISLDELIRALKLLHASADKLEVVEMVDLFIQESMRKVSAEARETLIKGVEDGVFYTGIEEILLEGEIGAILERFSTMPFPLAQELLENIARQYQIIQHFCEENHLLRMNELVLIASSIGIKSKLTETDSLQLIAIARLALRIKFGIYLHSTQILTVLGQLLSSSGSIAQVKTGEGKSMIVCVLAFVLSMQKKSVHIVSSSSNLAVRDQKKYECFFELFDITTSFISDWQGAESFRAAILYGSPADFEFAIMREMLYRTPLFPQISVAAPHKRFDYVIVDEVDNLTIDTGKDGARLSYTAEMTHDWVYEPIYKFISVYGKEEQKSFSYENIAHLKSFLSQEIEGRFHPLVRSLSDKVLNDLLASAHKAFFELKENEDYVIQNGTVLIVDASNTGRIKVGSRWSKGLHEFVEVKHGLLAKQESLTPISLSHPIYYLMYKGILGLTGTMGSQFERDEVREIYGIRSFDVPTYHVSRREDSPPVVFRSDQKRLEQIVAEVRMCRTLGRPILVLCKTIQQSITVQKELLASHIPHEILNETQEKNEDDILESAGYPGSVTVATYNAGRGTDIILKGESCNNGGLHVLIASFPDSLRVEEQARGRAGRQGDPGSSALFISVEDDLGLEEESALSDEEIIALLYHKRERMTSLAKYVHVRHAEVERFRFALTQHFFQKVSDFHLSISTILPRVSRDFASTRLLNAIQQDFTALGAQDALIAKEAFALLTNKADAVDISALWLSLLQQVVQRMHASIINDWAVNFYQYTEERADSTIAEYCGIQGQLRDRNPEAASAIEFAITNIMCELQNDFDRIFRAKLTKWNAHLDLSGEGIVFYLFEILEGRVVDYSEA